MQINEVVLAKDIIHASIIVVLCTNRHEHVDEHCGQVSVIVRGIDGGLAPQLLMMYIVGILYLYNSTSYQCLRMNTKERA